MVEITGVLPRSRAAKKGIVPGDILLEINGHAIRDVLDYRFRLAERTVCLKLHRGPELLEVTIRKDEYDDIGLEFATPLMDKKHRCENGCIFCFIDQNPAGMRESIYFKDDDSRLSFLHGNYITLTNLHDEDIDRILEMHISPVNVSVHTTNPELRVKMMANPRAGSCLSYLQQLADAGIKINVQMVLCPGINDGEELRRSLTDLEKLMPSLESVSCVPVGLTKFRDGLYPLQPYTKEEAAATIDLIHSFSDRFLEQYGSRIAYPSDEFFLKAERPFPSVEYYGAFDQLESGVGMMALLEDEFTQALEGVEPRRIERKLSTATGFASYPLIKKLADMLMERFEGLEICVYPIENRFFGKEITVSGLVTGKDLTEQLAGKDLGEALLIPSVMLRHEQDRFLDDMTVEEAQERLGVELRPVQSDGFLLADALAGEPLL